LVWGYKKINISGILKNIVFCNLVSNWWKVFVWELWNKEVDFVCEKDWEIIYLQVAYLLESEKRKRICSTFSHKR
jgi:predicted AAA+ superfamily ATPase